jgi:hypothetical protein
MNRSLVRLIVWIQIFTLFFLMMMPSLIRWLGGMWGKILYALMVIIGIGFALALRYALESLE